MLDGLFDAIGIGLGAGKTGKNIELAAKNNIKRLDPYAAAGTGATDMIMSLLGLGGGTGGGEALNKFRESTGYKDQLSAALGGAGANAAARGLLNSSGTGKVFQNTAAQIAQGSFGDFLNQLLGQQQVGQNAATTQANIGFEGGTAAAQARSKGGIFGSLFG